MDRQAMARKLKVDEKAVEGQSGRQACCGRAE